jgi:hypothetical protein
MGYLQNWGRWAKNYWSRLDISIREGGIAWGIYRLVLLAWNILLWKQTWIPMGKSDWANVLEVGGLQNFLDLWKHWDGVHYFKIASSGYYEDYLSVFFPLYPITARIVSLLGGVNPLVVLLFLSNLAALLVCIFLHRVVRDIFDLEAARKSLAAMLLFPFSFFLFAAYPQSLSLLEVLVCFWAVHRRRWILAGIIGVLAGLTHSTVMPLALAMGVEILMVLWVERRFYSRAIFLLVVPVLPFISLGGFFIWRELNGFSSFTAIQLARFGRVTCWPWVPFEQLAQELPKDIISMTNFPVIFNSLGLLLIIVSIILGIKRYPISWTVFQAAVLFGLLLTTTSYEPIMGFNRLVLVAFPIFVTLGALPRGKLGRLFAVALGMFFLLLFSAGFMLGYWVG